VREARDAVHCGGTRALVRFASVISTSCIARVRSRGGSRCFSPHPCCRCTGSLPGEGPGAAPTRANEARSTPHPGPWRDWPGYPIYSAGLSCPRGFNLLCLRPWPSTLHTVRQSQQLKATGKTMGLKRKWIKRVPGVPSDRFCAWAEGGNSVLTQGKETFWVKGSTEMRLLTHGPSLYYCSVCLIERLDWLGAAAY